MSKARGLKAGVRPHTVLQLTHSLLFESDKVDLSLEITSTWTHTHSHMPPPSEPDVRLPLLALLLDMDKFKRANLIPGKSFVSGRQNGSVRASAKKRSRGRSECDKMSINQRPGQEKILGWLLCTLEQQETRPGYSVSRVGEKPSFS